MYLSLLRSSSLLLISTLCLLAKNPTSPINIPLHPYQKSLKTINVTIGEKRYPFLFDTGGGLTLITPQLSKAAGCTPYGQLSGFRMNGERLDVKKCGSISMKLNNMPLKPKTGLFDLNALLPKDWPPLYGTLSLHTFQKNILTLDLRHNQLILESDRSFHQRIKDMLPVSIAIECASGGRAVDLFVEAHATYGTLRLLMDSGNIKGYILSPGALEQLEMNRSKIPEKTVFTLQIDTLKPREVSAFVEKGLIHDGALPATWMEQYIITLDLPNRKMWIKAY